VQSQNLPNWKDIRCQKKPAWNAGFNSN